MLEVSESGYYRYLKNKGKPEKDTLLSDEMQKILKEHPCNDNYGAPRMKQALEQRGFTAGLRRITRIMREHGWLHTPRRRPKGLTKADPAAMAAENLIKQDFSAEEPFRKLLTDITQIQCADGKLYISPILDCFNGEVLSLCMRDNMKKELCIDTVQRGFPRDFGGAAHPAEPQRCGSLLRQRPHGELLCNVEERTAVQASDLPDANGGS